VQPGNNKVELLKAEKPGMDILADLPELAKKHQGWEQISEGDRERLKWAGLFYRKPTPGQFMMRIRTTNGRATSLQLRTVADLSRRVGNEVLDITTRQQLELRAVKIRDVPDIFAALEGADLTSLQTGMDNIRNVNCCALAGLTPGELFDASPAGREYTKIFIGNRAFTNLPRKFNVAITGCLENCTHTDTQDLGMSPAVDEDGAQGFNVAVGGKMGSGGMRLASPLDVFIPPSDAAALAAEITLLFNDHGVRGPRNKCRLAFLVEAWGAPKFRDELEKRWGKPLARAGRDVRLPDKHSDHLGVAPQKQAGLFSVGLCVPTGRTNAADLEELARLADAYGSGETRLTTAQNIILVNIPDAKLDALLAEPLLKKYSPDPHPFTRGLVTCTGTDYCNLALIETKGIAKELDEKLRRAVPSPAAQSLTMHWSGCPAACGNHQASDIGFQGIKANVDGKVVDAVHVFVGGRTGREARPGEKIMELVPVSMLPELIPVLMKNMDTLKRIRRDRGAENRVVMVPAFAEPAPMPEEAVLE
jgi:ferredoxin-nitrite reductase